MRLTSDRATMLLPGIQFAARAPETATGVLLGEPFRNATPSLASLLEQRAVEAIEGIARGKNVAVQQRLAWSFADALVRWSPHETEALARIASHWAALPHPIAARGCGPAMAAALRSAGVVVSAGN